MPAGAELAKLQPELSRWCKSHAVFATLNNHDTSTRRTTTGAAMPAGAEVAKHQPALSLWNKSHAVFVKRKSPHSISLATTGSAASDDVQLAN